ncbi:MAG: hypothetical protein ACI4V3_08870 [Faecousia sp.]
MKQMTAFFLLVCLLCGLSGCYVPSAQENETVHITFAVTHADGSERTFELETEKSSLAEALLTEGLVAESAESAGLYDVVDGEKADWNDGEAWWCFFCNGEALTVGIAQTTLEDGASYAAVFTRGYGETDA